MPCMEVVNTVNPNSSGHKEKNYFFNFVSICDDRYSL